MKTIADDYASIASDPATKNRTSSSETTSANTEVENDFLYNTGSPVAGAKRTRLKGAADKNRYERVPGKCWYVRLPKLIS
jgi:hypothetical protein